MNFIEAVKLLELDENIKLMRRSKDLTIFPRYGTLMGKQGHTGFKLFIKDILAEDWYVVKNEKLHTFEEALEAYKLGKRIRRKDYDIGYVFPDSIFNAHCLFDNDDILANDWIIEKTK